MKTKKKFIGLLLLFSAATAMPAWADDYSYLTLQYGGVQESVALSALKKITFSGGQLLATTTSGVKTYALSTMEKMFFASEPTALRAVQDDAVALTYDRASQQLRVCRRDGAAVLRVYHANGGLMLSAPVAEGESTFSLSALPKGLYVVRVNQQTIKVIR